jgi:hypothetical protein
MSNYVEERAPMTIQRTDALVKDVLDRLTANFFRAVTFDEGEAPPYDSIYALFIESGTAHQEHGHHSRDIDCPRVY